ncbi:TNT domain-containing protein [Amycolatopsis sp. NBC_01286]|uniref:TNT domain-containing protein n=1 Tax=Amycolatopsis sp. NBC_01286 TaxID=2903560 RepID=UPI002E157277|nr:TNT domain-containing protein [Amycolatopsis sp. NBC_01286]
MRGALARANSQNVPVAQPTTQLNATEQDTLVKQIGLALLRAAPRDWRKVSAEYRAVGRYHELTGEIVTEDGTVHEWLATHDIATLFGRLRGGMYRDGRGTWFNARYQLDHPSSYNLEYNRDEPVWNLAPPPQAYSDELRMFPRTEENVPEWLIRRMSGLGPEQPGPHFRIARIFDTIGPAGRPVINRPDLEVDEQDRMLEYLDRAPLVVTERGYDIDRLAQTPEATVPVAFHSDGQWIWPAAVNFYLRKYGVSPEPDLVEHVRAVGFKLPPVDEPTLQAAGAYLTRGNPQQRPAGPPPQGPPPPQQQQQGPPPQQQAPAGPPQAAMAAQAPPAPPVPPVAPPQQHQEPPAQVEPPLLTHTAEPEAPAEEHYEDEAYPAAGAPQQEYTEEAEYAEDGYDDQEFDDRFAEDDQYTEDGHYEPAGHAAGTNGTTPEPGRVPDLEETAEYVPDQPIGQEEPAHDGVAFDAGQPEPADPHGFPQGRHDEEPAADEPAHAAFEPTQDAAGRTVFQPPVRDDDGFDDHVAHDDDEPARSAFEPGPPRREDEPAHAAAFDPGPPTMITQPEVPGVLPVPEPPAPQPAVQAPAQAEPAAPRSGRRALRRETPDHPVLAGLQSKLNELDVPESGYKLGEPAEHGWSVEQVDDGWRVGWYDGKLSNPAVFGDAEDAAAFMLGKLLLHPEGHVVAEEPPAPEPEPEPEPEPAPQRVVATLSPEIATGSYPVRKPEPVPLQEQTAFTSADELFGDLEDDEPPTPVRQPGPPAPVAAGPGGPPPLAQQQAGPPPLAPAPPRREPPQAAPTVLAPVPQGAPLVPSGPGRPEPVRGAVNGGGGGGNQQWPIGPMSGEPPLTLFRGKELRELPAGSELDRFGGPNGNLTYAAGTPFAERSLVPEWINRPYHVYRVQRPLETLAGVAIPWFNQPGGGSAYLLPASIEELVADGALLELDPGEPPID